MFVNYLTILLSKRFAFYRGISGHLINGSSLYSIRPEWKSSPQRWSSFAMLARPAPTYLLLLDKKVQPQDTNCTGWLWGRGGKFSSSRQDNKTLGGDWIHWREHISISHISSTKRRQYGQISSLLFCIVILWWVLLYSFERHFARICILPHTL